jgi:hypothetical protein
MEERTVRETEPPAFKNFNIPLKTRTLWRLFQGIIFYIWVVFSPLTLILFARFSHREMGTLNRPLNANLLPVA